MIPALDVEPHPHSVEIMSDMDGWSAAFRALAHEYGYKIVRDMLGEGYYDAREVRSLLETWRKRRQEQWLGTDYVEQHGMVKWLTSKHSVSAAFVRALTRQTVAQLKT